MQAPPTWHPWTIQWEPGTLDGWSEKWTAAQVIVKSEPGGIAVIDHEAACTTLHLPNRPTQEALLHPHLAATAVVANHWLGRLSFHGGSFCRGDGVWAVVGEREDGKSSALAWLALHEVGVFADDLLIVDHGKTFAGPRCLDLRQSAWRHFQVGQPLGIVGTRPRWRVTLPEVAPEQPLHGWVTLRWSDQVSVRWVPPQERLVRLAPHKAIRLDVDVDARDWLPLLALPMLELSRPRDYGSIDQAMDTLLSVIDQR